MGYSIKLNAVEKSYALYRHGIDRLREALTNRKRHREFVALHPLSLEVPRGEVLGLIGMNGAGKSTLLKLLAGTLAPSNGKIQVQGRVAALLELGAGFHPDMTGRENVFLAAAVMGLPIDRIEALYPGIVEFAGLEPFMEQPVKTYSSGMFVRLAFAVATSVDPDVLIVDEALSVGDGAFARKSFDRIMGFKKAGKTILFCSHSLYQVEAICSRVIWMHQGSVMMDGDPAQVTAAYSAFLGRQDAQREASGQLAALAAPHPGDSALAQRSAPEGCARLLQITVANRHAAGSELAMRSRMDDLVITIEFGSDVALPAPTLGVMIVGADGRPVCSAGSLNDSITIPRAPDGHGRATLTFPALALLKGRYWVHAYLLSEDGAHIYDEAANVAELQVSQQGLEQGVVSLPHRWDAQNASSPAAALADVTS